MYHNNSNNNKKNIYTYMETTQKAYELNSVCYCQYFLILYRTNIRIMQINFVLVWYGDIKNQRNQRDQS